MRNKVDFNDLPSEQVTLTLTQVQFRKLLSAIHKLPSAQSAVVVESDAITYHWVSRKDETIRMPKLTR